MEATQSNKQRHPKRSLQTVNRWCFEILFHSACYVIILGIISRRSTLTRKALVYNSQWVLFCSRFVRAIFYGESRWYTVLGIMPGLRVMDVTVKVVLLSWRAHSLRTVLHRSNNCTFYQCDPVCYCLLLASLRSGWRIHIPLEKWMKLTSSTAESDQ
jgi:hypothetical protein